SQAARPCSPRFRVQVLTVPGAWSGASSSAELVPLGLSGLFLSGSVLLFLRARVARLLRRLFLAAASTVVGGVEPGAAEMDRDGIEHRLDRRSAADRTSFGGRVGDPLEDFEDVPVRALVFIGRHQNEGR